MYVSLYVCCVSTYVWMYAPAYVYACVSECLRKCVCVSMCSCTCAHRRISVKAAQSVPCVFVKWGFMRDFLFSFWGGCYACLSLGQLGCNGGWDGAGRGEPISTISEHERRAFKARDFNKSLPKCCCVCVRVCAINHRRVRMLQSETENRFCCFVLSCRCHSRDFLIVFLNFRCCRLCACVCVRTCTSVSAAL